MSVGFPGKSDVFCSAAETGEEETAMEHIMETFSGANAALEESELNRFLKAMATGGASEEESEEEEDHGAHAHEEEAHAHEDDGHVATHVTAAELLREYGAAGEAATSLTEAEFTEACPELLKCAVDADCAFEYGEEEDAASGSTANPSKSYTKLKAGLAAAVFGESVFGWMIPTVSEAVAGRKARWVMSLLNAFSGGVFLSAGLTHLFPHLSLIHI